MPGSLRGPRRQLTSGSDPPPNPGPSSPKEPDGIFTANLKGVELANLAADTLAEVTAAAERGIRRIRTTHWLAYSFPYATAACLCGETIMPPERTKLSFGSHGPVLSASPRSCPREA